MSATTCPSCSGSLVEIERSGILIDACRDCRGIWLDRGELDKLIAAERTADDDFLREVRGESGSRPGRRDDDDDRHGAPGYRKPKRRRSILEEFLDFG